VYFRFWIYFLTRTPIPFSKTLNDHTALRNIRGSSIANTIVLTTGALRSALQKQSINNGIVKYRSKIRIDKKLKANSRHLSAPRDAQPFGRFRYSDNRAVLLELSTAKGRAHETH